MSDAAHIHCEHCAVEEKAPSAFKKYLPLIVAFAGVFLWTAVAQVSKGFSLHDSLDYFMGAYFIIFGGLKILNFKKFPASYAQYDMLASRSIWFARAYPFIELGLGFMFFFGINHRLANAITLVLMTEKSLSVSETLRKGSAPTCACLGGFFNIPVSRVTLYEDVLMALMAFVTLILYS